MDPSQSLCFALHAATRTLARCTMLVSESCRCDGVATSISKTSGALVCDVCATFIPDSAAADYESLPYAQGVRSAGLILARGAVNEVSFEEALPDVVAASTSLLAALPICPPFGGHCPRCRFSTDPVTLIVLDAELRQLTGWSSAPGSA